MSKQTLEMRKAFECLGLSPDADRETIRTAWKKLVRAYHPDRFKNNQAEGNRRLAELNAAFDVISGWAPQDAEAKERAARKRAHIRARKAAEMRAGFDRRKSDATFWDKTRDRRRVAEPVTGTRAQEPCRQEAASPPSPRRATPNPAQARFVSAMSDLAPRPASHFSVSF